jgi:NitT/TauT family transport system substrate-binding protein
MLTTQTRRRFLTTLSLAGGAGLVCPTLASTAQGILETTTVRFAKIANMCFAPQLVAEELLRAEGFTDIQYVDVVPAFLGSGVARGTVDLSMAYTSQFAAAIR